MDERPLREGGDIFASDMVQPEMISHIASTFEETTVFVTGGTGFIGKMFIEKLLRMSKTVKVFILVRPKKGKDGSTRFQEIFDGPNMVPLKLKNRNFGQQVRFIQGDCSEKELGLSEEDKQLLIQEVNFIIHCAASVRFDEELRKAAHTNVRALRDLLSISKKMKDLRGFLHVSTAYSFCPLKTIDEEFYQPGMKAEDLLHIVEIMDTEKLQSITPQLIKEWPNTYSFTKAIAEDLIKNEGGKLPIAVLRPSIVTASKSEPVAGWVGNFYGVSGIFLAIALGFLRTLVVKLNTKGDLIPADYVTNAGFAVLWDIAQKRSMNRNVEVPEEQNHVKIPIYNVVSSEESPITWRHFMVLARIARKVPTKHLLWYPFCIPVENRFIYNILSFFLQTIPAYVVDALCFCLGKERIMVMAHKKVNKFAEVLTYFTCNEWKFHNKNLRMLWDKTEPEDRRLYPFSMKNFDWESFMHSYVRGGRVYLLKDPLETIPQGETRFRILTILHFSLVAVLAVIAFFMLRFFCRLFI